MNTDKPKTSTHPKAMLPVGTIRIHSGVYRIKVKCHGPRKYQWRDYNRWLWEKFKGPVPDGKRVMSLDGNPFNHNLENLALGDPGDAFLIWRDERPKEAKKHYQRIHRIAGKINTLRASIHREREFLPTRWYAIDPVNRVIINRPHRLRYKILRDAGFEINADSQRMLTSIALGFPQLSAPVAAAVSALIEHGPMRLFSLCQKSDEIRSRFGIHLGKTTKNVLSSRMVSMPPNLINRTNIGRSKLYSASPNAIQIRNKTFPYTLIKGSVLQSDQDYRSWKKLPDYPELKPR